MAVNEQRYWTDSTSKAIDTWCKYNLRYPKQVAIFCGNYLDCVALCEDFLANCNKYYDKYWYGKNFPYGYMVLRYDCTMFVLGKKQVVFDGRPDDYDIAPVFRP